MATTKKKEEKPVTYMCYMCGKEISGDHIYIQTKRKTKLHIHFECMNTGRNKEERNEQTEIRD